ncbi:aminoglycoside phosphotransferase family protein [Xanthomonas sp. LMG 12459]|uniref:phosphotransferase enzyme family protein n=1 Tax=Xanthomonas sp. LMG 12459 TaxID=1591131 RepID=UPI001262BFC7|nr:aminoglycoside phosphotransferase family protein [Xanthomonas sp. LMG 12459]KAB7776956.1 aminoglycoside phosphotransferase [Xanthomonas sp. LMG 12459]
MSARHQMHGMGTQTVAADWPPLSDGEVEALLQQYALPGLLHALRWHSPRPFSAAAEVETAAGTLFVKRHHCRVRDLHALGEEHAFIAQLRAQGVPVPEVLRDRDGASAVRRGHWTYEVMRAGEGEDRYREAMSWTPFADTAHAAAAGRALAALHRAAAGYAAPPRSTTVLVANLRLFAQPRPLQALEHDLARRPALAAWLQQRDWQGDLRAQLLPWHAQAWPLLQTPPPALWTHGDWHASNLLWRGHGAASTVSAVFDFGLADRTFALFDLATAIERNLIPWLQLDDGGSAVADLDQLDALLHGYATLLPLDAAHLRLLAALLPLVHADFALSEIEYFAGITGSDAHADIAYRRYLLGHAAWFGESEGQRLLRHLQRRAAAAS